MKRNMQYSGTVYFVGVGPGDPELITLKAKRLIGQADVVVYAGSLVNPALLEYARSDVELHNSAGMKLDEQIQVMTAAVEKGQMVARLHTGDPAVYGATLEQMRELEVRGVPYAVVPGVSSAFAAAAALGIEFTVPGDTQTVIFTRLSGRTPVPERESLRKLASHRASLVVFLSAGMVARVVDDLYEAGYSPDTPVAVVYRASWPDELVLRGTLADIVAQMEEAEITHQALIVISPALDESKAAGEAAQDSHLYGAALEEPLRCPTTAVIALTRGGAQTGRRLHNLLPESVLYVPTWFDTVPDGQPNVVSYDTSVRQVLQSAFQEHSALVCIMASGIVVRELAPLLRSKHVDPAVVVLDEAGQYAVSLLGGHKGGANALAREIAGLLAGTPVLTTSSDVQKLPSLDLLGGEKGWTLTRLKYMTEVIAALANGEVVGVFQEGGDEDWWPDPVPANLVRFSSLEALAEAAPPAALIITHRSISQQTLDALPHSIIYHPPCLVVGVGCNRGTPADEIEEAIEQTLAEAELELQSVSHLATIEGKKDEPGLQAVANSLGWPVRVFSREEVAAVTDVPNPSDWAQKALGVPGVAEPAALLGANAASLLVEKRKFPNVTVAVALIGGRSVK